MNWRMPARYAAWQARDHALGAGVAMTVIVVLMSFLMSRIASSGSAAATPDRVLNGIVGAFDWVVVALTTAGLVSGDLGTGYYRSIFSRPVSPAMFYLQKWLIGAAFVAAFVPLAGLGVLAVTGRYAYSGALEVRVVLLYLMLGGLIFALSTMLRRDWIIAILIMILQNVLHSMDAARTGLSAVARGILFLLPPLHAAGSGPGIAGYPGRGDLLHALAYGAGLVVAAVLILTRRPLGSGGRV